MTWIWQKKPKNPSVNSFAKLTALIFIYASIVSASLTQNKLIKMCFITMYIKTIPLGLQVCNYLFFLQVLSSKKWGKLWFDVFVYNTKVKDSMILFLSRTAVLLW